MLQEINGKAHKQRSHAFLSKDLASGTERAAVIVLGTLQQEKGSVNERVRGVHFTSLEKPLSCMRRRMTSSGYDTVWAVMPATPPTSSLKGTVR